MKLNLKKAQAVIAKSKFLQFALIFSLLLCVRFFYIGSKILNFSTQSNESIGTVAIILGHGIDDGELSPTFQERVDHSIILYKSQRVDFLIFTGGVPPRRRYSDSWYAKEYAIMKGIPEASIFLEEKSTSTYQNLLFAKKIIHQKNWDSVLLVTDPLHMYRASKICERLNIKIEPSPALIAVQRPWYQKIYSLFYEILAFHAEWVLGHL